METKYCPQRGLMIKDNWGKWRRGQEIQCLSCNKCIITRLDRSSKYCSKVCSDLGRKKEVIVTCTYCNKEFVKKPSSLQNSKSGLYFCTRQCKDLAQKIANGLQEIWPDHYNTGLATYRNQIDITTCVGCGCSDYWKLIVHHVNGNRDNNSLENLEVVCANCHCNRHSKIIDDRRIFDTHYITDRDTVKRLDMGL